jgi:cytochrome P450
MAFLVYAIRTPTVHETHMDQLYKLMENFSKVLEPGATPPIDFYPFLKWFPERLLGNWISRAKEVHDEMHGLYAGMVNKVKDRRQQRGRKDSLVDRVLDQQEKLNLTEHEVWFLAGVAMEGGSDTSSASILCFMKAMTCFPDVQKRAQTEIDRVIGNDRTPMWSDYDSLPYVSQVVKETMRWRPVGGIGVPHATNKGMSIEHHFPSADQTPSMPLTRLSPRNRRLD